MSKVQVPSGRRPVPRVEPRPTDISYHNKLTPGVGTLDSLHTLRYPAAIMQLLPLRQSIAGLVAVAIAILVRVA